MPFLKFSLNKKFVLSFICISIIVYIFKGETFYLLLVTFYTILVAFSRYLLHFTCSLLLFTCYSLLFTGYSLFFTYALGFFDLVLPIFLLSFWFIFILGEFFLEFWKIIKVTPKAREQRGIYIFTKQIFFLQSKFFISFSQLVISDELGAIYFDISFFCFHCWKINGILSFLFLLCH